MEILILVNILCMSRANYKTEKYLNWKINIHLNLGYSIILSKNFEFLTNINVCCVRIIFTILPILCNQLLQKTLNMAFISAMTIFCETYRL